MTRTARRSLLTIIVLAFIILVIALVSTHYRQPDVSPNQTTGAATATDLTSRWGCLSRQSDDLAISIENTLSDTERVQGLMGRSYLPSHYGMLFTFADFGWHSMWMKNTLIALDFLALDQNWHVTSLLQNIQPCLPDSDCQTFAVGPSKHIVELAAGEIYRSQIQVGQQFVWSPGAKCR